MYANDGYYARVMENRDLFLEPLLKLVRTTNHNHNHNNVDNSLLQLGHNYIHIIHIPNNHNIQKISNLQCQPQTNEYIANTTMQLHQYMKLHHIHTLLYVGYATNRDMLYGVGGAFLL